MHPRHSSFRRRTAAGLVAGIALIALGGCYPYYYDVRYQHNDGYYRGGHQADRYHRDGRRHHHSHRGDRERYRHYRHYNRY